MTLKIYEMRDAVWEESHLKILIKDFIQMKNREPTKKEIKKMRHQAHEAFSEIYNRKETELTGN